MLPEPEKKTVDYYRRLSEKDLMTGLYNRGSFEYYVKKRLESGEGGTFYMIDLDDFKAVNDTYGHVAATGSSWTWPISYAGNLQRKQSSAAGRR